jgi:hypothetical protein
MTPEQAELSLSREEGYGKLSAEQQGLLKDCNLNVKQRTFMGIGGFQRVISGTIRGSKVEIIFTPSQSWEAVAEAKVDGESVSQEEAVNLRHRYQAVAEFQTKQSIDLKQSNVEINKKKTLREKVLGLLS